MSARWVRNTLLEQISLYPNAYLFDLWIKVVMQCGFDGVDEQGKAFAVKCPSYGIPFKYTLGLDDIDFST